MVQCIKTLATNPDVLSSLPWICMGTMNSQKLSSDHYMCTMVHVPTPAPLRTD